MKRSIWVGFDPREQDAFHVAVRSIQAHLSDAIPIFAVALEPLQRKGVYQRPMQRRNGQLWDLISDAPMSTEFAISRFLVPHLAGEGLALFMDCDMLVRVDVAELFDRFDPNHAVECVQHRHEPAGGTKMDGQIQTGYPFKNWSSVMMINCDHPANKALTVTKINTWAGRALHSFAWLEGDHLIGALDKSWNHLVGVDKPDPDCRIAHMTLGIQSMPGYAECEHAEEWRSYLG